MKTRILHRTMLLTIYLTAAVSCSHFGIPDIDTDIQYRMESMHAPGLQAAIVRGDSVVWKQSWGIADTGTGEEMTDDHLLMVGSISKTIVGTIIMQLAEENRIDIDADISGYLPFAVRNPWFPNVTITARMLMQHRSGMLDNWVHLLKGFPERSPLTPAEFMEAYLTDEGELYDKNANWYSGAEPGTVELYSNAGITLLALAAETIENSDFDTISRTRLFSPLRMTAFWHPADAAGYSIAQGSELDGTPLPPESFYAWPAGSLECSAADLAEFLAVYAGSGTHNGTDYLSPGSIDDMLTPFDAASGHGLIWSKGVVSIDGEYYWGHGGKYAGYKSYACFDRDEQIAIVVLTNGDEMDTYAFYEITRMLIRKAREYPL